MSAFTLVTTAVLVKVLWVDRIRNRVGLVFGLRLTVRSLATLFLNESILRTTYL